MKCGCEVTVSRKFRNVIGNNELSEISYRAEISYCMMHEMANRMMKLTQILADLSPYYNPSSDTGVVTVSRPALKNPPRLTGVDLHLAKQFISVIKNNE